MSNTNYEQHIQLLFDEASGIYIPKRWLNECTMRTTSWRGFNMKYVMRYLNNPGHEFYWDCWNEVLNNAYAIMDGTKYTLHHDGDLWIVSEHMTEEQWEEWCC